MSTSLWRLKFYSMKAFQKHLTYPHHQVVTEKFWSPSDTPTPLNSNGIFGRLKGKTRFEFYFIFSKMTAQSCTPFNNQKLSIIIWWLKKIDHHLIDHHYPMVTKFFNRQKMKAMKAFQKHMTCPHIVVIEKFQLAQRRTTKKISVIVLLVTKTFWSS